MPTVETRKPVSAKSVSALSKRLKAYFAANRDNVRLIACYFALASAGWNDACLGPLIPYMEKYYDISYTIISTMFISQCAGSLISGLTNNRVTDMFGMGRVVTAAAFLQTAAYAVTIAPPPFAGLPVAWSIVGLAVGYIDAQTNSWVAGLPNAHIKLGYLHGAYGIGALASPLVATAFVGAGIKFSHFFAVSLAVAACDLLVLSLCFWKEPRPSDMPHENPSTLPNVVSERGQAGSPDGSQTPGPDEGIELKDLVASSDAVPAENQLAAEAVVLPKTTTSKDKRIMTNRHVWVTASFLFLYVGAEVTIGGWIVSFLINERGGGTSVGYVASGFWAGIALGRLVLPRFNAWFGERNVIFLYIVIALALEMVIWFAKQLIANAVAVSLIGFILGPFFPIAISVIGKLLPRYLHAGAIGLIAAIGSAGAAIFPFVTGALAQKYGAWVLQPMIIALLAAMAVLWLNVPSPPQYRKEQ